MNGTIFNRPIQEESGSSFLEQVKKNEDTKKKQNLKLILTIILSNIFVAYLSYSPEKSPQEDPNSHTLLQHPGYQMMILNIIPLLQIDGAVQERKITLLDSKKRIILQLGYLHDEIKNELNSDIRRFKIEIPKDQILKMGAYSEENLIAIPALELSKTPKNNKGSAYEINI